MKGIRVRRGPAGRPLPASRTTAFPGCPLAPPQPPVGGGRRGRLRRGADLRLCPSAGSSSPHQPAPPPRTKAPAQGKGREAENRE